MSVNPYAALSAMLRGVPHSTGERRIRGIRPHVTQRIEVARSYSQCLRCRRDDTPEHKTQVTQFEGCFPLCEVCWVGLGTPQARLPWYWRLWKSWVSDAPDQKEVRRLWTYWPEMARAVMDGK